MPNNIIFIGTFVLCLITALGLFFGASSKSPKSPENTEKTPNLDKLIKQCKDKNLANKAKTELKNLKGETK